jgi:hypothetical protein
VRPEVTALLLITSRWSFGGPDSRVTAVVHPPATISFESDGRTVDVAFSADAEALAVRSARVPALFDDELLYATASRTRADGVTLEIALLSRRGRSLRPLFAAPLEIVFPEAEAVCVDTQARADTPIAVLQRDPDDGIPCICWPHRVRITRYRLRDDALERAAVSVTDRSYPSAVAAARASRLPCTLNLADLRSHSRVARPSKSTRGRP